MIGWIDGALSGLGFLAYVILFLASCLEYLVPPLPGDTVILLGGVTAVRGHQPVLLVFIAVVSGSALGSTLAYAFGAWLRRRMDQRPEEKPLFGLTRERLDAVDRQMQRWGAWLLVLNRFLPGVRSLIFVAAGSAGMNVSRALGLGVVASALHTALIVGAGWAVGGNLEELTRWVTQSQWVVASLIGLAALGLTVKWLSGRKRAPEAG
jgi:membrane protein DedA with SNARE-associated domain